MTRKKELSIHPACIVFDSNLTVPLAASVSGQTTLWTPAGAYETRLNQVHRPLRRAVSLACPHFTLCGSPSPTVGLFLPSGSSDHSFLEDVSNVLSDDTLEADPCTFTPMELLDFELGISDESA
jgi:hypothetical protein